MFHLLVPVLVLLALSPHSQAQTWCGKHYMKSTPPIPPGGEFQTPQSSSQPLLALRCAQAIRPYLPSDTNSPDDPTAISILIDSPVTFSRIANAAPISLSSDNTLQVTVSVNGHTLTTGNVPLNATKHALPFSLSALQPTKSAYNISCVATHSGQTFRASTLLTYLPEPPTSIGSVTKMDLRTGALLARPANGKGGPFAPVFPFGFYTQFDSYLAKNLSISAELAQQGFTVVHPVPTFSDMTTLDRVLDKMQEAGLYLMYDMRGTYMDAASVTAQVNHIKSRPNLLLWYTADEPDGTSDPLDATLKSSNLITSLDGGDGVGGAGYHPVSLVLNCEDYFFTEYTEGCDIVLQDTYMVGNNVTFSSEWGTPCTRDYGDCGCDNCKGSFEDISTRMDEFRDRLFINGWERTKAVWTVPQGFGSETYWKRFPTGPEFVVESALGINHGALGVVSWDDPTTPDIKSFASSFSRAVVSKLSTPFILNPSATFRHLVINRVDIGLWTSSINGQRQVMVLATNMNSQSTSITLSQLGLPATGTSSGIEVVYDGNGGGAILDAARNRLLFQAVGTGAWIVTLNDQTSPDSPFQTDSARTNDGASSRLLSPMAMTARESFMLLMALTMLRLVMWMGI